MVYPTHSLTKRMKKSCPVRETSYNIHTHRRIGLVPKPLQLEIIKHCRPRRCIRRYIMYCTYMIYYFFYRS